MQHTYGYVPIETLLIISNIYYASASYWSNHYTHKLHAHILNSTSKFYPYSSPVLIYLKDCIATCTSTYSTFIWSTPTLTPSLRVLCSGRSGTQLSLPLWFLSCLFLPPSSPNFPPRHLTRPKIRPVLLLTIQRPQGGVSWPPRVDTRWQRHVRDNNNKTSCLSCPRMFTRDTWPGSLKGHIGRFLQGLATGPVQALHRKSTLDILLYK